MGGERQDDEQEQQPPQVETEAPLGRFNDTDENNDNLSVGDTRLHEA